ncbi:MAG: CoA transferase [Desulfobacteraceae bacterium]|jgi:crotonobetainyl-CoA:carnitine CoA-transferase CaiB-like acyl-CoA transferase
MAAPAPLPASASMVATANCEGMATMARSGAPHGCYRCRGIDRWCVIAVFDESQWAALCRAMGDPHWTREERFSTMSHRMAHADPLDALLEQWTSRRAAETIVADLQRAGIPCGVVQNARDLANDPHLNKREFFAEMDHPILRKMATDTSPVRFKTMDAQPLKSSPLLGQDNRHVFVDLLGLTEEEYGRYIEKGVIG